MLEIVIPGQELFNDKTQEFIETKPQKIVLEHSLVSISKWESKWGIPFLNSNEKTSEQILDYIKCMCITQNISDEVFNRLTKENINDIVAYIEAPMTATTIKKRNGRNREIITSELIYYWMVTFNIPVDFQKWHLNRLMTLISVCSEKNAPKKNMSKRELLNQNAALNAKRRAAMNSRG